MTHGPLDTVVMVPTLWRAEQIGPFLEALTKNAGSIPVRPLFLVSDDDDATLVAVAREGADMMTFSSVGGTPMSMVAKCNTAGKTVTEPFLFGASDDIRILPGCLETVHAALEDPTVHVACVSDRISAHLHDGELTGHCLIRMSYIREQSGVLDEPNMLMHHGYVHYFSDLELWQVAKLRGCYRSCFDALVEHRHPNDGTAPIDRTNQWGRDHLTQDRLTYQRRSWMWDQVPA